MTDNSSSLLAATAPADDVASHVVLQASIGGPPHIGDSTLSENPGSSSLADSSIEDVAARNPAYDPSVSDVHLQNVVPFYRRPHFYSTLLQTFSQNFLFPFINGVMLGFGEICANEIAFRMGWFGVRNLPIYTRRANAIALGPKDNYATGAHRQSKKTKTVDGREVEIDEENSKMAYAEASTSAAIM
ncbi:10108_t:CDS:1 [Acaulospora morrowiae]|uniref:10108_t:CDS:1 n=1 Tax=Acaulospora morrowiae TaxID=94023 RepID=A0A9N8Z6Z1_9GLOM|nr:10108_t:CDS:1 [Acaulospora morrowiae]